MNVKSKNRIYSIQSLRAIAFLGVCLSHCGIGEAGTWGVSVFIILSGFLMTYNYYEKNIEKMNLKESIIFSIHKIRKLYLLHIITMVFAVLIEVVKIKNFLVDIKNLIFKIIVNILLIQAWVPKISINFSLNGVSWYLSLCAFLYFSFPFVQRCQKNISRI